MENYDKYIDYLYSAQNVGASPTQRNLYSKEKYEKLLASVLEVLRENKDATLDELREKLFEKANIKATLEDFFYRKKKVPGAVITYGSPNYQETIVIGNKEEIVKKSDNFKENIVPMEEDTIFDLASVTKLFTAISILKLVEMGDVKLGDDITKYVPQFDNLKGVSIFNLLTFIPLKTDTRIDKAKTKEEAENILFGAKRIDSPSIGNPYNDIAPMVLKYVIENVSGLSYYDFLEKFVLKDVNMRDTLVKECGNREKFASGNFDGRYYKDDSFLIRDKAIPGVSTDDKARILGQAEGNLSGHAGLFSTASDMEKMARGLIDSKIINERARNSMAKNRTGRLFVDELGNIRHSAYFGMLCHSKNPNLANSEVHHPLSGLSFAAEGWSGTQLTVDPLLGINFFMGSNRSHNRLTVLDKEQRDKLRVLKDGRRIIELPCGYEMTDATRFAFEKDDSIVHPCIELALQYKMLEDLTLSKEKEVKENKTLYLKRS